MEELQKKIAVLEQLLEDEGMEIEHKKIVIERLERQLGQLQLINNELEKELNAKNEQCLELEHEITTLQNTKQQLLVDLNQMGKIDDKWQKQINDLSIEHELRYDQVTHAVAELQESLEARMPAKRRKKSEIPAPKKKEKKNLELNLC